MLAEEVYLEKFVRIGSGHQT